MTNPLSTSTDITSVTSIITSPVIPSNFPTQLITLLHQIFQDYPNFQFKFGSKFSFRPPRTITLGPPQPNYGLLALHELGHALCKHKDYKLHVQRLKIESEAWETAKSLCLKHPHYQIVFDSDFAQSQLDTYRDWLHQKSLCPRCQLTRFQSSNGNYHCPRCDLLS